MRLGGARMNRGNSMQHVAAKVVGVSTIIAGAGTLVAGIANLDGAIGTDAGLAEARDLPDRFRKQAQEHGFDVEQGVALIEEGIAGIDANSPGWHAASTGAIVGGGVAVLGGLASLVGPSPMRPVARAVGLAAVAGAGVSSLVALDRFHRSEREVARMTIGTLGAQGPFIDAALEGRTLPTAERSTA